MANPLDPFESNVAVADAPNVAAEGANPLDPFQSPVETEDKVMAADDPSIPQYLRYNVMMGAAMNEYDTYYSAVRDGRMSYQDAKKALDYSVGEWHRKAGGYKQLSISEHPVKAIAGDVSMQLPYMGLTAIEGGKYALGGSMIAGGMAAWAGQAGPQALLPEELATIPGAMFAGSKVGYGLGVVQKTKGIEGGQMFFQMVEDGIDPKVAMPIAEIGGSIMGLIELGEHLLVASGGIGIAKSVGEAAKAKVKKGLVGFITSNSAKKILGAAGLAWVKAGGGEFAEEELQAATELISRSAAGIIDKKYDTIPKASEWREQMIEQAPRMALSLFIITLPGIGANAATRFKLAGKAKEAYKVEVGLDTINVLNEIDPKASTPEAIAENDAKIAAFKEKHQELAGDAVADVQSTYEYIKLGMKPDKALAQVVMERKQAQEMKPGYGLTPQTVPDYAMEVVPAEKVDLIQQIFQAQDHKAAMDLMLKDPEYRALHKEMLESGQKDFVISDDPTQWPDYYHEFLEKESGVLIPQAKGKPTAIIWIGMPGSQKSMYIKALGLRNEYVLIDPDVAKEYDPDYKKNPHLANYVQGQSAYMAEELLYLKVKNEKKNIIMVKVGKGEGTISSMIDRLRRDGYTVKLWMNDLSVIESQKRSFKRWIENKRLVPIEEYIGKIGDLTIGKVYDKMKLKADGFLRLNVNVKFGQKAILMERGGVDGKTDLGEGVEDRSQQAGPGSNVGLLQREGAAQGAAQGQAAAAPAAGATGRLSKAIIEARSPQEVIDLVLQNIPGLQERLQDMDERQQTIEVTKEALQELNMMRHELEHSIQKYTSRGAKKGTKYLAEELQGIPAYYITKETTAMKPDEMVDHLRENYGIDVVDEVGLKEYLIGLEETHKRYVQDLKNARPQVISKKETTILAETIKNLTQGIKAGRTFTLAEVKKYQAEAIELLESAKMDPKDRAKFIRAIKNIQTEKDFVKALPELTRRIIELRETQQRRELISEIKDMAAKAKESSSIAVEYSQLIDSIVKQYEMKGHKEETIQALKATQEYMARQEKAGEKVEMPREVLKQLEVLNRKPVSELTTEELANLRDQIEQLDLIGRTKLRLRQLADQRAKENALAAIKTTSKPLVEEGLVRPPIGESLDLQDKLKNLWTMTVNTIKKKDLALSPMDVIIDLLDGSKNYQGANYKTFKARVDQAFRDYLKMNRDVVTPVVERAKELKLDQGNFDRIGAYAADQQEGGREKLLNSGYTAQEIDAIILSPEENEIYEMMRTALDKLRAPIADVMRLVYNEPFYEVANYFPFMTDFEKMSDAEIRSRFGDKVEQFGQAPRKHAERGMTKRRTLGEQTIKINAMEVFLRHVDNAAYLVNVGKETKFLGDIAATPDYGEAVGNLGQEVMREWIDTMARKGRIAGERWNLMDTMRKHTGAAILAYRLSSVLVQPTSILDGAGLIGNYAFNGTHKIASSREWRKFVLNNFEEVRNRSGDDIAFLDFGSSADNIMAQTINKAEQVGFWALKSLDLLAASSVAAGAYQKYMDEHGMAVDLATPNKEALAYAQMMMRRTQASSFYKDAPGALTRGKLTGSKSLDKMVLQFQTFMLNRWSLIRHDLWRAGIKEGRMGQAMNIAMFLTLATIAESGLKRGLKILMAELAGDPLEDDEDNNLMNDITVNALQAIPFVGSIVQSLRYGSNPIPTVEFSTRILKRFSAAVNSDDPDLARSHLIRAIVTALPGGAQWDSVVKNILEED